MSPLFSTRFNCIRSSLYICLLSFALIELGFDAHVVSGAIVGRILAYLIFLPVVTIAIVLAFVFVLPHVRPGLGLVQLKYELGVLATLWIVWIAAAADATSAFTYFMSYCGRYFLDENGEIYFTGPPCSEPQAILAFSWLAWITLTTLLGYVATLAFLEHGKGHPDVWHTLTIEYPFDSNTSNTTTHTDAPDAEANMEQVVPVGENKEHVEQPPIAPIQQQQQQQQQV